MVCGLSKCQDNQRNIIKSSNFQRITGIFKFIAKKMGHQHRNPFMTQGHVIIGYQHNIVVGILMDWHEPYLRHLMKYHALEQPTNEKRKSEDH